MFGESNFNGVLRAKLVDPFTGTSMTKVELNDWSSRSTENYVKWAQNLINPLSTWSKSARACSYHFPKCAIDGGTSRIRGNATLLERTTTPLKNWWTSLFVKTVFLYLWKTWRQAIEMVDRGNHTPYCNLHLVSSSNGASFFKVNINWRPFGATRLVKSITGRQIVQYSFHR